MPPRHGKGRRSQIARKVKERQQATTAAQPPVAQTAGRAPAAEKAATRTAAPPSAFTLNYPYIRTELVRIAVLTGIILFILVVLTWVSPKF